MPRAAGAGKEGHLDRSRANLIDAFLGDDRLPGARAAKIKTLQEAEATASDADADIIIEQAAFLDMEDITEKWYSRATGAGVELKESTFSAVLRAMLKNDAGVEAMEKWTSRASAGDVKIPFEPILSAAGMKNDPELFRNLVAVRDKYFPKPKVKNAYGKLDNLEAQLMATMVNKDFRKTHGRTC